MFSPPISILTVVLAAVIGTQHVLCDLFSFQPQPDYLTLTTKDGPDPEILVSSDDWDGVLRAASDLAIDFGLVTGHNGTVVTDTEDLGSDFPIIVGTLGRSKLVDGLVSEGKLEVSQIEGKWESFVQKVVSDPLSGVPMALVIAGSDKRGTIYGLYDISEIIGVSPWYWWADVPAKSKEGIFVNPTETKIDGPTIKYRGIFINDESQLQSWAEQSGLFKLSTQGRVYWDGTFYKLLFELLLRLKANYLWTPMKLSGSFYLDDPDNGDIADTYGVVIGTSHHEPMARSYYEQQSYLTGKWDWSENKENVQKFMEVGANRSTGWETAYTMGMRGDGDSESPTLTSSQLEEIIGIQQEIITNYTHKNLADVPQNWVLYKEVGQYWQAGMTVDERVTLMWTDDNFGNLLRIPLKNETSRSGGHGIYYHFGYVGHPRDYEWILTVQLVKTWEQMYLAYINDAREAWIVNVQDVKPYEIPMTHFLDMAWDMSRYETPDSTTEWIKRWSRREFGPGIEDATANILNTYGRLVVRRKYETLNMEPYAYSILYYDEVPYVMQEWQDLLDLSQGIYDGLSAPVKETFYELVHYTVIAGYHMEYLYFYRNLGRLYLGQRRTVTNDMSWKAIAEYAADKANTARYNAIFDSKWNGIPNATHIGYDSWDPPSMDSLPTLSWMNDSLIPSSGILGVAAQGVGTSIGVGESITLRSVDPYMPKRDSRYIEVFTRANGTFTYEIQSNASYVQVTSDQGQLEAPGNNSVARSEITVDWEKAPEGLSWVALSVSNEAETGDSTAKVLLPVNKTTTPSSFEGYVESNGIISIEAAHYASSSNESGVSYIEVPWYGRTLSGIKLWPATARSQTTETGPALKYNFYSFTEKSDARIIILLGGTINLDPLRPLKLAHSIDSGEVTTKQVIADYPAGQTPTDWDTAVIRGGWNTTTTDVSITRGEHTLNLWLLEPEVIVQKVIIDTGGFLGPSSLGPPESTYVG